MLSPELFHPSSIVVVGGSNDVSKPGGKVLANILAGGYARPLFVLNPRERSVQGVPSFARPEDLPYAGLAIIAIAAKAVPEAVRSLIRSRGTKAFIVLSAGFSEENAAGLALEREVAGMIADHGGSLIGPNCIGLLTPHYQGVFASPIPTLHPNGCDLISSSGSTACFIMELGAPMGLTFANVFSVGNGAQIGIEEMLEHCDETFDPDRSPKVKLLYIEKIAKPQKLLRHAASLVRKGCRIAAIKAGSSEAGIRAAASHTGAMSGSDAAAGALMRKAGIVRCGSKEELVNVACVLRYRPLHGPKIAVITNAGGPGVMAADALTRNGLQVPMLHDQALLSRLHPGSSTANPIDYLATGSAAQLDAIIDEMDSRNPDVDGMVVILGTPGMAAAFDAHRVLAQRIMRGRKPIYPVLPSTATARAEIAEFVSGGGVYFHDEVALAKALASVYHAPAPATGEPPPAGVDTGRARHIVAGASDGFLPPEAVEALLNAAKIPVVAARIVREKSLLREAAGALGYPLAMKAVGPVHKTEVGGVLLGLSGPEEIDKAFSQLMAKPGVQAVMIQRMINGIELFAGVSFEPSFGHVVFCGLGGIFVEVLGDVVSALAPLHTSEVGAMLTSLKCYRLFQPFRNQTIVNESKFSDIILRLSELVTAVPEIRELDLNPLMANGDEILAVDARIRIEKSDHITGAQHA